MSTVAIRLEGVSKRYRIRTVDSDMPGGTPVRAPSKLSEAITGGVRSAVDRAGAVLRRGGGSRRPTPRARTFWALRDVSLDIRHGEVVGLIGRNGAGKSSMLKLIARITEPSEGLIEVRGRVGSLLEVGTGFHQELTGRDNVFLGGTILGMKRAEIARKFDEIVAFAEVEKFIDTPVKHYSSGMYLRLAFAVAAHLEPEILLVDEVLAVGDVRFQKKCLNKMQDVGQRGRTVLFVSHNMSAITRLCSRAILLEDGKVRMDGRPPQVVGAYMNSGVDMTGLRVWPDPEKAPGRDVARLRAVRVMAEDGTTTDSVDIRQPVVLEMEYEVLKGGYVLLPSFDVANEEGVLAFVTLDRDPAWRGRVRLPGRYVSRARIPGNFLTEGTMFVHAFLCTMSPVHEYQFGEYNVVAFHVFDPLAEDSVRADFTGHLGGVVRPWLDWSTRVSSNGDEDAGLR